MIEFIVLIGSFFGRLYHRIVDATLSKIPGLNSIYNTVKQIIDTFATTQSNAFKEVVLIEYPQKDIYALAFLTSETKGEIAMRSFHAHGDVQIHVRRCDFWSICEHRHNANGCHQNQGGAILFSQPRTAMRSARLCTVVLWNLTHCSFRADCNRGA